MAVFSFEKLEGVSPTNPPSSMTLSSSLALPAQFTLCSSHLQGRVDGVGPYQLYGQDGLPWLAFQFYANSNRFFELWVFFGEKMQFIGEVGVARLNFWYHTCLMVDTGGNGSLAASVNGRLVSSGRQARLLTVNIPSSLTNNLKLGISVANPARPKREAQFLWSVTNIQLFSVPRMAVFWPGCGDAGDLMAWVNMAWSRNGKHIRETDQEHVCSQDYMAAVDIPMSQNQAIEACQKLGNGILPSPKSKSEFDSYLMWFNNVTSNDCPDSWTPLLLEHGVLMNLENNGSTNYFFGKDKPDDMTPGVSINKIAKAMVGSDPILIKCFACSLSRAFNLLLRGKTCKTSYLGKVSLEFFDNIFPIYQIPGTP